MVLSCQALGIHTSRLSRSKTAVWDGRKEMSSCGGIWGPTFGVNYQSPMTNSNTLDPKPQLSAREASSLFRSGPFRCLCSALPGTLPTCWLDLSTREVEGDRGILQMSQQTFYKRKSPGVTPQRRCILVILPGALRSAQSLPWWWRSVCIFWKENRGCIITGEFSELILFTKSCFVHLSQGYI